ncbi:hypothetical protein L3X38_032290 [Prunus dulcis]|uniref:Transposable element protein n=1 Tax=Prunus dulcis TaxID=3755 RepID=A0AAD4VEV1_PRUDU|nr:hypothetical protein L3X38_032290 [Prunus dulcis]
MHQPSKSHWQALKRLLRYLKGTLYFGLHLSRRPSHHLYAFLYVDWVDDRDDCKSTTIDVATSFLGDLTKNAMLPVLPLWWNIGLFHPPLLN